MSILAMVSGGLDSAAMLVKLLTDTREPVRVHHIVIASREGRDHVETLAARRIAAWCQRRARPFRYSQSTLEFRGLRAIPIDYLAVAYAACQVAIDTPGCRRIATGALAQDTDIENRCARQRRAFAVMYDCYRAREIGEAQVDWIYPVYAMTKQEVAAFLPSDLLALTWSCRTPVRTASGYRVCGTCKTCHARAGVPTTERVEHADELREST